MTRHSRSPIRLRLHRGALADLPSVRPLRRVAARRRCQGPAALVEDVLHQAHPALCAMLGAERVEQLALEFVASHPFYSGHPGDLAEILPGFLEVALLEDSSRGEWLLDFVRLERAIAAARRTPALPALWPSSLGARAGEPQPDLLPVPSLHLLELSHDVDDVYQAVLEQRPWLEPVERASWLAVYRRGAEIRRMQLARPAFLLLRGLAAGLAWAEARVAAFEDARREGWSERAFERRAALWLRLWLAESLLVRPCQVPGDAAGRCEA